MGRLGFSRVDNTEIDDTSPTESIERPSYADIVASCKRSSDRLVAVAAKCKEKK